MWKILKSISVSTLFPFRRVHDMDTLYGLMHMTPKKLLTMLDPRMRLLNVKGGVTRLLEAMVEQEHIEVIYNYEVKVSSMFFLSHGSLLH